MGWIVDWRECWGRGCLARAPLADVIALIAAVQRFATTGDGEFVGGDGFTGVLHVGPWSLLLLLSPRCPARDENAQDERLEDVIFVLDARRIAT
jgi:hypothetical protein